MPGHPRSPRRLLAALVLLLACQGGSAAIARDGEASRDAGRPPVTGGSRDADGEGAGVRHVVDSLLVEFRATPSAEGGTRFVLVVENVAERPLTLYLRGREPVLDVELARAGGAVLARRLDGAVVPAIVQLRPLAPGERLEVTATWTPRPRGASTLPAGEYTLRGLLLAEGDAAIASAPLRLRVDGR